MTAKPALCLCGKPPLPAKARDRDHESGKFMYTIACATSTCGCSIKEHLGFKDEAVKAWNKQVREKADKAILEAVIALNTIEPILGTHKDIAAVKESFERSYDKASEDYVRLTKVLESFPGQGPLGV